MKIYFGGTEIKAWRTLLINEKVPCASLSFVGLTRRIQNTTDWSIADNYPGQQVFLDSGGYTYNKDITSYTREQAVETSNKYKEFVTANIDRLSLVSEFDAQQLGYDYIKEARDWFYNSLPPDKFMPIWHTEYGFDELETLCSVYEVVGICREDMHDDTIIPALNAAANRYGTRLHGVAITSKNTMQEVAWDSVSSMSWLSPSVYGDTIVWTGRELKRYPRDYKANARKKHRTLFIDHGFDAEKIESDDSQELLRLSLWSWQEFTNSIVAPHGRNNKDRNPESPGTAVDIQGGQTWNGNRSPAITNRRETMTIPVMGLSSYEVKTEEGTEQVPFIITRSESMRACNTCFLRDKCPGFEPDANCLYNMPIEVKTKPQLEALQAALIEMQTHRVMFMQMAEDIEGGYADPNLSSEMDRLQRMISKKVDADKIRLSSYQEVELPSPGPGIFESLFGADASAKVQALPASVKADDIIKDSEIYDAELINE